MKRKKSKPRREELNSAYRVVFRLFSNEQMQAFPEALPGDMVECLFCGKDHKLESATCVRTKKKDAMFLIYKCNRRWEIGAVFGKLIAGRIPEKQVDDECTSS
jgi:hypothetical protein